MEMHGDAAIPEPGAQRRGARAGAIMAAAGSPCPRSPLIFPFFVRSFHSLTHHLPLAGRRRAVSRHAASALRSQAGASSSSPSAHDATRHTAGQLPTLPIRLNDSGGSAE